MKFEKAQDIQKRISFLISELKMEYIKPQQVVCFRSWGSVSRARARIWSMPSIWQIALNIEPHYCIEVLSEKFDRMTLDDQEKVLIHELLHIPKGFGGGLVPHRTSKHRSFHHYHDSVDNLFNRLETKSYE